MTLDLPRTHHQPRVEVRPAQPYVGIAADAADEDGFRAAMDRNVPAAFGWVAEQGLVPSGAPFIRYLVVDEFGARGQGPPPATFEACVPLAAPAPRTSGGIVAGELPAGRWIVALHRGGYSGLGDLHRIVHEWAGEERLVVARTAVAGGTAFGGSTEQFRVGPFEEPDPWRWETDVAYLLADD